MSRSSRQRRSQQYAVSLFPFLAVLVCTLGVLIVMLVMAVRAADVEGQKRHKAVVQQQEIAEQQVKTARERRELAELQALSILSVRSDLTDRLQVAKSDRSYLQQQIKATNNQAEDLLAAIANLTKVLNAKAIDTSAARNQADVGKEIERLKSQIASAKQSLKQLREDQSFQMQTEYAIVPFTGSGGTHRQPIFIECVRDGLVLQPYGINLKRVDFVQPLTIGNMLDSALLTVREYWDKHGLSGEDSKPYPLLVVRPDGAESYGLARRAMKSWDDEFGYELVDRDTKLRFGQSDLQLKSEIEAAVETAKRRQQRLARQRQMNHDDQWNSALQLARGLRPSNSGGFEFAATGQPAHELLTKDGVKADADGRGHSQDKNSFSRASFERPHSDSDFRNQYRNQYREKNTAAREAASFNQMSGDAPRDTLRDEVNDVDQQGNVALGNSTGSLANSRGANWALPAETTGARAYVRPIRLICEADQILILSQNRVTATLPLHSQTVASIDPLVSEIWKTIEAWGLAGRQAYWKPELRFSVASGGERRFQELRALLDGSGLLLEVSHQR